VWEYRASVLTVLDGDTLRLHVDLGFYARHQVDLRLSGVQAPEMNQLGGTETKQFVENWCATLSPLKWPISISTSVTSSIEPLEKLTFTRYIGFLYKIDTRESLNASINLFLASHPEWGGGM
jgi:hypothetical protein